MKKRDFSHLKKLIDQPSRQKEVIITHHHKDHTKGLQRYKGIVHCTNKTSKLLPQGRYQIQIHEIYQVFKIKNLQITFIDSKHSPGSVMVLINDGNQNILHTSDFRYQDQQIPENIDILYMDFTFCNQMFQFMQLEQAALELKRFMQETTEKIYLRMDPVTHYQFFKKLYELTGKQIGISQKNFSAIFFLELQTNIFTTLEAIIYALNHGEYIQKEKKDGIKLIQTGWSSFQNIQKGKYLNEYVLPYSNHCNFQEIKNFIARFPTALKYSISPPRKHSKKSIFSIMDDFDLKNL